VETHFHENKHDGKHIYVETLNQDNDNQDERNYILRTHMKRNRNSTYEHGIDAKKKKKKQRHPKVHRKS
jgi:hypothetical protein